MAENLNGYLSSMFTRDDISSLPVPDAKFHENYLGQLIVAPEMVANTIKAMKDNKFIWSVWYSANTANRNIRTN